MTAAVEPRRMAAWLRDRVELSRRTGVLALGDAAMIALFVALGGRHHGVTAAAALATLVQFGLGWLLVAVPARVYAPTVVASPRRTAVLGVAAWAGAVLVAQLVRLLVTPGAVVQPVFVVVSVAVGGAFIGTWRFAAATALR